MQLGISKGKAVLYFCFLDTYKYTERNEERDIIYRYM